MRKYVKIAALLLCALPRKEFEAQNAGLEAGAQALKDEAIRVVKLMPNWQPGKQRGKEVRVKYTIPVMYRLN